MNEIEQLKQRITKLEETINHFVRPDGYRFGKPKVGFNNVEPFAPMSAPTGLTDTSGSSGTTMTTGHRFNGNTGTTYYSVGDIVKALKDVGLIR